MYRGGICHARHRTPEVEGVGNVSTYAEEDEENEVYRVTQNLFMSAILPTQLIDERETYQLLSRSNPAQVAVRRNTVALA